MRPPICTLCHERFFAGGGLVQFAITSAEQAELKRFEQPGFVGHPPGLEWFCEQHLAGARSLCHLTLGQALQLLRAQGVPPCE